MNSRSNIEVHLEMIRVCRHIIRRYIMHHKKKKHGLFGDICILFFFCVMLIHRSFYALFHKRVYIYNFF